MQSNLLSENVDSDDLKRTMEQLTKTRG